jgi:NTP pyrophosphatase (non-canonical NTP hydrolase)
MTERRPGSGKLRRVAPHTFEVDGALRLRPEVLAFAQIMEQKLRANDHKGGWKSDAPGPLFDRMLEEVNEAWQAMLKWPRDTKAYRDSLAGELADVANFAMMVADQNGCLKR